MIICNGWRLFRMASNVQKNKEEKGNIEYVNSLFRVTEISYGSAHWTIHIDLKHSRENKIDSRTLSQWWGREYKMTQELFPNDEKENVRWLQNSFLMMRQWENCKKDLLKAQVKNIFS